MSRLADFNTIESRITVFAEELKEISKTSKLTPEIIDIVADTYIDMTCCHGLMVFARDEEKIAEIIESLQDENGDLVVLVSTDELADRFDKEGIDYIFDHHELF